jgi:CheY-like chemotaxis protein
MTTRDESISKPPGVYDAPETTGVHMSPPDGERAAVIERAARAGVPGIDVRVLPLDLVDLDLLPRELARRHQALPILVRDDALFLAMADASNRQAISEVEFVTGKRVFVYGADADALCDLIDSAYDLRARGQTDYAPERPSLAPPPPGATRPSSPGLVRPRELPESSPPRRPRQVTLAPPSASGGLFGAPIAPTRMPSAPPQAMPTRTTTAGVPRRRALVIDADADARRVLCDALASIGFATHETTSGAAALAALRASPPALVMLDPSLPDMHGFELLRALRAEPGLARVPIVVASAEYRGWHIARDLGDLYAVHSVIEKPATPAAIVVHASEALTPDEALGDEVLPSEAERALQRSNEAWQRGDIDAAVGALDAAVAAAPDSFRVRYHLGLTLGRKGDVFRAIREMERSIALRDRFFPSLRNLAVLYERAGFRHKALEAWERACASAPDEPTRDQIKERVLALL